MDIRERLFINGTWMAPASSATLEVVSPATEEPVGRVPAAGPHDVDRAVAAAREAFDHGPWPRLATAVRAEYLRALRDALGSRIESLAHTITLETGSPIAYSTRMQRAVLELLDFYADAAPAVDRVDQRQGRGTDVRVLREPVGVAALILPWNGPFGTLITKLAPALLAGCTLVAKPAPETPLDAYLVGEAAVEIGLPAGVLNIVHGAADVGAHLVSHPGVDKVSVTGSVETGRRVYAAGAEGMKRLTLELGGKSPCIILPGAPLAEATVCAARAGFLNAGQVCVAWTRIFAPTESYDEIVERMSAQAAARRLLDPLDPRSQMGPLTTRAQRDKTERYVAGAVADGARVVTGGRRPPEHKRGWWYEPTILAEVANTMAVARDEIFGPVVSIIRYEEPDDAITMANDSEYGLAAGVWGSSVEDAWEVARRLRAGTVSINTFAIEDTSPFGGFKRSGIGREWGLEGLDGYLESKTVATPRDENP